MLKVSFKMGLSFSKIILKAKVVETIELRKKGTTGLENILREKKFKTE